VAYLESFARDSVSNYR